MAEAKMEQICARAIADVAESESVEATVEPKTGATAELVPEQACISGKADVAESESVEATVEPKTGATAEIEPGEASATDTAEAKTNEQILVFAQVCKLQVFLVSPYYALPHQMIQMCN